MVGSLNRPSGSALSSRGTLVLGLLCLIFYLLIDSLLSHVVLSSYARLDLKLEIDQEDRFFVYYKAGERAHFSGKRVVTSKPIPPAAATTVSFRLNDRVARNLRLDPGDRTRSVKLYALTLSSHFGPQTHFDAATLHGLFEPRRSISNYRLEGNHVAFDVSGTDPQLYSRETLRIDNAFIDHLFPLILTLVFYLIISDFRWREFPAIADLSRDLTSTHINYTALDGIRGFAVLLVLLDHSWGIFTGAGTAGVWVFFVLSGFLLTIPFVDKPERGIQPQYMRSYLLRRLMRIIPMYYVYVVTSFFIGGNVSSGAIRHLLFLQGDGHLWTIQQEMLFYLVLPLIMTANYLLFRGRPAWVIATLAVMMVSANLWLDKSVISLYSVNIIRPPFVGVFICGMLFSYIYHGIILKKEIGLLQSPVLRSAISLLALLTVFMYVLLGTDTLFAPGTYLPHKVPGWFGFVAGMLILAVLLTPGTLYSRLFSWTPLRALGLVGYSFYLWHPMVISLVKLLQDHYLGFRTHPVWLVLSVLLLTYLLSAFTYTYIERPFLKRAR